LTLLKNMLIERVLRKSSRKDRLTKFFSVAH
jgi:hypothetical protein